MCIRDSGKTVVAAFLVGSRGTRRQAVGLAAAVALSHTSGVFVLGGLTLAASATFPLERVYGWLQLCSAVIVLGLGPGLALAGSMGFGGACISLAMSKMMAKGSTGARIIDSPSTSTEFWLVEPVRKQAEKAGIETRLGTEVSPEIVRELDPCGVFVACGAEPLVPPIPGINEDSVCTAEEVLLGREKLQGRVVVVGSGMTGLETAEMLAMDGCTVTIVEMLDEVGAGVYPAVVQDVMGRISQHDAVILTGHRLEKVTPAGVELTRLSDGEKVAVNADRVVLARQAVWPERMFSLLAGFVEAGESFETCVVREIAEEIGLSVRDVHYLGSQPWPFPRSLMVGFHAIADPQQPFSFNDGEIVEARWFTRAEVRAALEVGDWGSADTSDSELLLPGSVSIAREIIEAWAWRD